MTELSATTNLSSMTARRFAERNSNLAARATADLASGTITSDPSRAPSESAIEARLNSKLSIQATAQKNASQLTTLIQMGTGALKTLQDITSRMQALATQANSDGVDDATRAMLDQEYQQLLAQIDFTAQTTRWGDTQILNGSATSATTALGAVTEAFGTLVAPTTTANSFSTTYTAGNTQGVIDGVVTDATVVANGGMYDVTVVVGGKTFKSTVAAPTNAGTLTLTNVKDGTSAIGFTYGAAGASMGTAAVFQSNLRELLGVDTGSKAVATSTSVALFTGVTSVTAGAAAASGTYALTYTVSGSTGTFRISDGNNVSTATIATSATSGTVAIGNFSIALSGFTGTSSFTNQAMFKVTNTSNMTMTGQIDSESTDTLSVVFSSTNSSSLSLSGGDIKSKTTAATAQTNLKAAASTISNLIAQLGGKRSQLDFQVENLKISQANNAAAKSAVVDTNIAEATDRLMKFKALSGIAQSVFSQAIQNTQNLADLLARI